MVYHARLERTIARCEGERIYRTHNVLSHNTRDYTPLQKHARLKECCSSEEVQHDLSANEIY